MNYRLLILSLVLFLTLFISGCQYSAGVKCKSDQNCFSNRCIEGFCDYSSLNEKCGYDSDCLESICENDICIKSEQGGRCNVDEDCTDQTFCFKEEYGIEGKCVKNNFICKIFADNFGTSNFWILFSLVFIFFLVYFGLEALLGVPLFSIHGVTFTLLGAIITAWILFTIFFSSCV